MSAHGIPGAFSSAIKTILKWILIAFVVLILFRFVSTLFPTFNQGSVKDMISKNNSKNIKEKDEFAFDFYNPKTWTYDAMVERSQNASKNDQTKYFKPILMPSINEYEESTNSNTNGYILNEYKENTTQSEWYSDGSMWSN